MDGILVCGRPGRGKHERQRTEYPASLGPSSFFTIDVRGDLKPDITPARTPPDGIFGLLRRTDKWRRLQALGNLAEGRLWEKVAEYLQSGLAQSEFWKLGLVYDARFANMRSRAIWEEVAFPLVDEAGNTKWVKLGDLGTASIESADKDFDLVTTDGSRISPAVELVDNLADQCKSDFIFMMKSLAALMGTLAVRGQEVHLEFYPPSDGMKAPSEFILRSGGFFGGYVISYDVEYETLLAIQCAFSSVNRKHPLVQFALESEFVEKKDAIQEFAGSVVNFFADKDQLEKIASNPSVVTYWAKRIGWKYSEIDWSRYDEKLRGPYRVWLKEKGVVEITEDDFNRWAHAEVSR